MLFRACRSHLHVFRAPSRRVRVMVNARPGRIRQLRMRVIFVLNLRRVQVLERSSSTPSFKHRYYSIYGLRVVATITARAPAALLGIYIVWRSHTHERKPTCCKIFAVQSDCRTANLRIPNLTLHVHMYILFALD